MNKILLFFRSYPWIFIFLGVVLIISGSLILFQDKEWENFLAYAVIAFFSGIVFLIKGIAWITPIKKRSFTGTKEKMGRLRDPYFQNQNSSYALHTE